MRAIKVKFLQATNKKQSRLKATMDDGRSKTVLYQFENLENEVRTLAEDFYKQLGWPPAKLLEGSYKGEWFFVPIATRE